MTPMTNRCQGVHQRYRAIRYRRVMAHRLLQFLLDAAIGRFPAADGGVTVLPTLPNGTAAVVAFTGHAVVATSLTPNQIAGLHLDGYGGSIAPAALLTSLAAPPSEPMTSPSSDEAWAGAGPSFGPLPNGMTARVSGMRDRCARMWGCSATNVGSSRSDRAWQAG